MEDVEDSDFKPGDGGFFGDKRKHSKPRMYKSPSSASNTSTGGTKRLKWDFVRSVELTLPRRESKAQIEQEMIKQLALAGPCRLETTEGEKTFGGWKLHRV